MIAYVGRMPVLYPEIAPHSSGMIDVAGGHALYWETCGRPGGKPALVLHGGPGSGCRPNHRRLFDPARYHVTLFDQRGCGRSRPLAADSLDALRHNRIADLIADIETLRNHLGIDAWLVFGGSWGSSLALVYAQAYPQRVTELVLAGVTTTSRAEIDWLYGRIGQMMPAEFATFRAGVPGGGFGAELVAAYVELLADPDPAIVDKAAADWCRWEAALVEVDPRAKPSVRWRDAAFRRNFARIVTHYFSDDNLLDGGAVLGGMARLAGIPGVMIHSRFDPSAPLATAWALSETWPAAELVILDGALHSATDGAMAEQVVKATDRFAGRNGGGPVSGPMP